ncbi:hypothetical protein KC363_g3876 [Hortaea werneckii]|nr:hypothetical protein KC363_g3876 [Hortaea werneckii]
MAYRQLVEKYAKQLNDANGRIIDLETTVADRDAELERTKVAANPRCSQTKMDQAKVALSDARASKATSEKALRDQVEELNNEIKSVNGDRKVLNQIIIDLRKPVQEKQAKVAELERSVALEKKRRLEAEALLGPDGKRCKTCNPIVVDLEADDGESAQGSAQHAQVPKKPKPSLKTVPRPRHYGRASKTTRS